MHGDAWGYSGMHEDLENSSKMSSHESPSFLKVFLTAHSYAKEVLKFVTYTLALLEVVYIAFFDFR